VSGKAMLWLGPDDPDPDVTLELVGGKAEGLWRMGRLGLNIPPAFALPASLCAEVNADPDRAADLVRPGLKAGLERLEAAAGRRFGDSRGPLLVSVRSGAARSMPGMLSTVLNVGLNPEAVHGLIRLTGDPRQGWDCYRRFLESYAVVVAGAPPAAFARRAAQVIAAEGVSGEDELDGEALERLSADFAAIALAETGEPVTEDPFDQLQRAALAVYRSWDGHRAKEYRRLNGLEGLAGTAVTVQAMVFGNAGRRSGSGVAFSRDPATGAKGLYVDVLFDAQGEDVVSGRRTPLDAGRLAARLPDAFAELERGMQRLEGDARDVQDVEFTIERDRLFFLQTRSAKRTPRAALRTAMDMVREGLICPAEALRRLDGLDLKLAGRSRFADEVPALASGIAASAGVASGRAAFDSGRAKSLTAGGDPAILVRAEPSTDDIEGFAVSAGILTARGGRTAHAAVVARQLGKVCVVGCAGLEIDEDGSGAQLCGQPLNDGDWLSLDGGTGAVTLGQREVVLEAPEAELAEIERWRAAEAVPA
jgi:pyruvate,orthophosphate dikinase